MGTGTGTFKSTCRLPMQIPRVDMFFDALGEEIDEGTGLLEVNAMRTLSLVGGTCGSAI